VDFSALDHGDYRLVFRRISDQYGNPPQIVFGLLVVAVGIIVMLWWAVAVFRGSYRSAAISK
jgi:hypothetical protein